MNSGVNNLETMDAHRFSLQTLFVLVTFFAFYFSAATIIGLETNVTIAIGLIIALRVPVVFLARRIAISAPLLLTQLAIPILLYWPSSHSEFASSRIGSTTESEWIGYTVVYLATPLFMFLVDANERYITRNQKLLRILVEAIFLIVWGGITCLILIELLGN